MPISARSETGAVVSALRDSVAHLMDYERWGTLAWKDISLRYRRTVFGPWWVTLSTGVMIGSVGLVWAAIFGSDLAAYLPYLAAGLILWAFISSALTEGCSVFAQAGALIKSTPTPLMIHVYRMIARQLIVLAHNAALVLLIWLAFRWPVGWSVLLLVPGLAIMVVMLTGAVLALGILCARFRDVYQMVMAGLQLLFLLTPIIWMPQVLRGRPAAYLMELNPFYHLIEVVRAPVLGHAPEPLAWLAAAVTAIVSLLIGCMLYGRYQHRVVYWL
jgi:ABC-type polysaccharide/polyol phosphate export permease